MFQKLANLHQKCFPNKPWSADDFRDLKNSGCEIIMSENGFIVYRIVVDEAEIITIGVPDINSLDKAQADIFYSTLLDIILEYYKDHPEEKTSLL